MNDVTIKFIDGDFVGRAQCGSRACVLAVALAHAARWRAHARALTRAGAARIDQDSNRATAMSPSPPTALNGHCGRFIYTNSQ